MSFKLLLRSIIPRPIKIFLRLDNYYYQGFYFYIFIKRIVCNARNFISGFPLKQSVPAIRSNITLMDSVGLITSDILKQAGIAFSEGRHCLYISTKDSIAIINGQLSNRYPCEVALKLVKSKEISGNGTPYYTSKKNAHASNCITIRAVGSVFEKVIISNLLSLSKYAPRVYDLICLESSGVICYALVVQHVDGDVVRGERGCFFIEKFKKAVEHHEIDMVATRKSKDFRPPDFNENIISGPFGPMYVDIQNFGILKKRKHYYPQGLLQRFNLGIPGTISVSDNAKRLSSWKKRKLHRRIKEFYFLCNSILSKQGLNIFNRSLLDAGYPLGLFTLWALATGARWSYILDMKKDGKNAEKYLFENGFSRFELIQFPSKNEKALEKNRIDCLCYSLRYGLRLLLTLTNSMKPQFVLIDTCFSNCEKDILLSVNLKLKENGFLFSDSDNMGSNNAGSGLLLYQKTEPLK